jgi:hypothetical protein
MSTVRVLPAHLFLTLHCMSTYSVFRHVIAIPQRLVSHSGVAWFFLAPGASTTRATPNRNHFFFPMARQPYMGLGLLVSSRLHDHTLFRHITLGRTPLDEWSARRRDLYLTTHNTHNRQTSMPPVGFFFFLPFRGFSPLIHFCTV